MAGQHFLFVCVFVLFLRIIAGLSSRAYIYFHYFHLKKEVLFPIASKQLNVLKYIFFFTSIQSYICIQSKKHLPVKVVEVTHTIKQI